MRTTTTPATATTTITAVLLPPDAARGRWGTLCARHNHVEAWPSRRVAQIALAHPGDWCDHCAADCRSEELCSA